MGNRIEIHTRYHKQGLPQVHVQDDYATGGWVSISADFSELERVHWLDAALEVSGDFLDTLEAGVENQTAAYFDAADFDLEAFWNTRDARQARRSEQRLEKQLPPATPSRPRSRV